MKPRLGSLFSGIGGIDKGFQDAGWEVGYQVEIDKSCQRVLQKHWPDVPRWNDIRSVNSQELPQVDCVAAGVPCQDVSLAGKRVGLNGKRTSLFWEFMRVLEQTCPGWFLFENVPGLLSSNQRRDFWVVISVLCEIGYGLAWRMLDSRYFGVPQRRRRIYIVGRLGTPCPPEILFEPKSGKRDLATGEGAQKDVAYTIRTMAGNRCLSQEDNYVCALSDPDGMREVAGIPRRMDASAFDWPPDAPRYRGLGNAVTVNVARWIANRMMQAWLKQK